MLSQIRKTFDRPCFALSLLSIALITMALRPLIDSPAASAQSRVRNLYIEPGVTGIRTPDGSGQVQGKVVMDLDTGDLWGFPTLSGAPYPVDVTTPKPPVSKPIYLGKFDLSAMHRP